MKRISLAIVGLLLATTAFAVTLPSPTGFVVDQTGKLNQQNIAEMSAIATRLSQGSGPEVAVAVVESISPETIESYGIKLAESWKVGKKGKDNGVILIVARQERKIRIEVGYGLEGVLPDSKAGRIIADVISPKLKSGDWNGGVRAGFDSIVNAIGGAK